MVRSECMNDVKVSIECENRVRPCKWMKSKKSSTWKSQCERKSNLRFQSSKGLLLVLGHRANQCCVTSSQYRETSSHCRPYQVICIYVQFTYLESTKSCGNVVMLFGLSLCLWALSLQKFIEFVCQPTFFQP